MSENSLWITSIGEDKSSQPILDYIRNQGKDLSDQTNGKIKGILVKAGSSLASIVDALSLISGQAPYNPTHHKGLNDASELYNKTTYEFLIVDEIHKYELSIFKITCNDTLPANLSIDSIIAKEESLDSNCSIFSLEDFKGIFRRIVTSDKVVYVIDRLLKLPEPQPEVSKEKPLQSSDNNRKDE